jgi:hypothetical protein
MSLSGCGGSSTSASSASGSSLPISVAVTASAATVDATDSLALSAALTNDTKAAGVNWTVSGGGALSGMTATGATYKAPAASTSAVKVVVTATSVSDATKSGTATITVLSGPAITTASLASGAVGTAYSAALAGSGGVSPYSWTVAGGTLPGGLSLSKAGVISGTPLASGAGTASLTIEMTDSGAATALTTTAQLGLTIDAAPPVAFASSALAAATIGTAYNASVTATGGAGALTYTLASGTLPTGLAISAAGALSGTSTASGSFEFSVKAADAFGDSATQGLSLRVNASSLAVTPATLPAGYVGVTYSPATLAATGGSGTGYRWSLASGSALPAGLTLSTAGVLGGKPAAAVTTTFSVMVADSVSNTATGTFSITIDQALTITSSNPLPAAIAGAAYSQTLTATGGSGAGYTWSLASGSTLPAGMTLSTAGVLAGKAAVAGTTVFNVTVTDSASNAATGTLSIVVDEPLSITSSPTLPAANVGAAYTQTFAATGGSGTGYTWSVASGSTLPVGLTLSTAGVLGGKPTVSGTSRFSVTVADSASSTATAAFSISIKGPLNITTATLPSAYLGATYLQTLTATGGSGKGYTWILAGGSTLPSWLSLSGAGQLSGKPSEMGFATFTVLVTDSASNMSMATLSISVLETITITTLPTLPGSFVGENYYTTLTAVGGSSSGYNWKLTSGSTLPAGLTLFPGGSLSGKPTATGTFGFGITVTDSAANSASATFSLTVGAGITITTPTTLPSGSVGSNYSLSLAATGGTGTGYSWSVTSGAGSLAAVKLNLSKAGVLSGKPAATGTASFTVTVTDSFADTASANLTLEIDAAGSLVSGQIMLSNNCGGIATPPITVSIDTNPVQTTITDGNGNYSFASIPSGTYTITPSIAGPSSVFYPAALNGVVVNNIPVTGQNFAVSLGYSVSGTLSYSGTQTGQIYVSLNSSNCGGNNPLGTSIAVPGPFTINGVPPGTYVLSAAMDTLGFGSLNQADPSGSKSHVAVSNTDVTGASLAITDPASPDLASGPGPALNAISPTDLGVVINFGAITTTNGAGNQVEAPTSYTVEWSTDPNFISPAPASYSFAAGGANGTSVWFLNNGTSGMTGSFSNGTAYYFRARGVAAGGNSPWINYGGSTPLAVTIGAPSAVNTMSGTVTFTGNATGPLYVGFFDISTGHAYATQIAKPVSPQGYTIQVPSGSSYFFFGVLDQNNDGMIDPGDLSNTRNNQSSGVDVSGNQTEDLALTAINSTALVTTQHWTQTIQSNTNTGFNLSFDVNEGDKLPVAVSLISGPNVLDPVDIGKCINCGNNHFQYSVGISSATPNVGDSYAFQVTYSDGTAEQVTATIGGILSGFATGLLPDGTGGSTTPTFTWTDDPTSGANYFYQYYLSDSNGNQIWQIPGNNSKSNGLTSAITSIPWGTDPTDPSNIPSVPTLTGGATYYWQIQSQDVNGNTAQTQVQYIP